MVVGRDMYECLLAWLGWVQWVQIPLPLLPSLLCWSTAAFAVRRSNAHAKSSFCAATIREDQPSRRGTFGSAPASRSELRHPPCLPLHARKSACVPFARTLSGAAPAERSWRTQLVWPCVEANMSAVQPCPVALSTSHLRQKYTVKCCTRHWLLLPHALIHIIHYTCILHRHITLRCMPCAAHYAPLPSTPHSAPHHTQATYYHYVSVCINAYHSLLLRVTSPLRATSCRCVPLRVIPITTCYVLLRATTFYDVYTTYPASRRRRVLASSPRRAEMERMWGWRWVWEFECILILTTEVD